MPPRDPYVPVPTAQPRQVRGEVATEPIHVDFPLVHPSGAVGEALGRLGQEGYGTLSRATQHVATAFDSFGKSLEGAGDQLWNRAIGLLQVENETKASNAIVEYENYVEQKREELKQKQGEAANSISLKMFNNDLEAKRQELRSKLPGMAQRRFDYPTIRASGSAGTFAANYIATQAKVATVGSASAEVDMSVKGMADSNSFAEYMQSHDRAEAQIRDRIAPAKGLTKPEVEVAVREAGEKGWGAMLTRISKDNPVLAREMMEQNPKMFINPGAQQQVENSIRTNELRIVSRNIGDRQTADMYKTRTNEEMENEPSLRERIESGLEELDKRPMLAAEPDAKRSVIDAITHNYNKALAQRKDDRDRALRTIDSGLSGEGRPDKRPPETIEELRAISPDKIDAAIATLRTKADRDYVAKGLKQNQARLAEVDPMVSYSRWEKLRGIAAGGHAQEFLDATDKLFDLGLNKGDRELVKKLREKVLGDPRGDPRTQEAWRVLQTTRGPEMSALGIDGPRTKENKDDVDAAHGALDDALNTFRETKGRPPTREEIKTEIGPQILRHKAATGFLFWGEREQFPAWSSRTDVPEKFKDDYDKRLTAAGLKPPADHDDVEYRRAYVHKLFMDSMKKPESTETAKTPQRALSGRHTAYDRTKPKPIPAQAATSQPAPVPISE